MIGAIHFEISDRQAAENAKMFPIAHICLTVFAVKWTLIRRKAGRVFLIISRERGYDLTFTNSLPIYYFVYGENKCTANAYLLTPENQLQNMYDLIIRQKN